MTASVYRGSEQERGWRRSALMALVIAFHAIIILLLLIHKDIIPAPQIQSSLNTFFVPGRKEQAEHGDRSNRPHETKAGEKVAAAKPVPKIQPPVVQPPKRAPEAPVVPSLLSMSSADYAATDIGRMQSQRQTGGDQGNAAATYGPGEGPGGVQLFNADWYREPTDAELSFYLPPNRPSEGWGLVACRTIEHFHVDDCQTIGEYPLGSGFGRAVREAAWQFLVRPPRINGKPQIGAWVRIRITYGTIAAPR